MVNSICQLDHHVHCTSDSCFHWNAAICAGSCPGSLLWPLALFGWATLNFLLQLRGREDSCTYELCHRYEPWKEVHYSFLKLHYFKVEENKSRNTSTSSLHSVITDSKVKSVLITHIPPFLLLFPFHPFTFLFLLNFMDQKQIQAFYLIIQGHTSAVTECLLWMSKDSHFPVPPIVAQHLSGLDGLSWQIINHFTINDPFPQICCFL